MTRGEESTASGPEATVEAPTSVAPRPLAVPADLAATLVLLRHGQSEWLAAGRFQGRSDTPLTALGRRQADLAGARLAAPDAPPRLPVPAGEPVAIVHSPLARTRQTAEAVAEAFREAGRPVPVLRPEDRLAEIAQGAWEGLSQGEVEERYPAEIAGWRRNPVAVHAPGGESLATVDARVREALVDVLNDLGAVAGPGAAGTHSYYSPQAGPWTILVGHDGTFKVALLALLGLPLDRFWTFTQTTTGIAVLDIRNGRTVLHAWNRTEHLAALEHEAAEATRAEEAAAERARSGAL
ncbi:MAG TPA: histidine phosphatase family protein [Patescibacteria group bacterium]|nr:histidine phosphatase family protein [Patescibacteria group bacterium]